MHRHLNSYAPRDLDTGGGQRRKRKQKTRLDDRERYRMYNVVHPFPFPNTTALDSMAPTENARKHRMSSYRKS